MFRFNAVCRLRDKQEAEGRKITWKEGGKQIDPRPVLLIGARPLSCPTKRLQS